MATAPFNGLTLRLGSTLVMLRWTANLANTTDKLDVAVQTYTNDILASANIVSVAQSSVLSSPTVGIIVELQAARVPDTSGSNWIRVQVVDANKQVLETWHLNVI